MFKRLLFIAFMCLTFSSFAQQKKSRLAKPEVDYYTSAKRFMDAGDIALSIGYCEEGLRQEPTNMDLQNLLAKGYLLNGELDKARTQLLFILKVQKHNKDAKRNLINVEYEAKHYSAALSHINEFLDHDPYDSKMWVKKISIYENVGQQFEAERLSSRFYKIFPQDSNAQRLNSYYTLNRANVSLKSGNIYKAKEDLIEVLKADPKNYDANVQLINTLIKNGNKEEAISATDNALFKFPGNKYFISKKLGLLEELKRYSEAIEYAQTIQKKYPGTLYKPYINNLKFQAARQAKLNDPYNLYQDLLESNPGNEEAMNYVINNAISKGFWEDANTYVDKALKSRPNNKDLLQKKFVVLKGLHKDGQAYALAEKLFNSNRGNSDIQEQYLTLALSNAKDLVAGQQWSSAEELLKKISPYSSVQPTAKEYLFTVYSQQKKYAQALTTINELIRSNPKNETYKLNKIGMLETKGDLVAALEATNALPRSERYKETYTNLSLPLVKQFIEQEKYDSALVLTDKILLVDEENLQAFNYALNICNATKQYQNGIGYADMALEQFPDSKEILMKRAGFLQSLKRNTESTVILDNLQKTYPYNDKIKSSLIEDRTISAKKYLRVNAKDSAMNLYKLNLALDPTDTISNYKIVNLYVEDKNTDSAMHYINLGLDENPENAQLLMKKAVVFELNKQYDSSFIYINKLIPKQSITSYQDYADYLFSKTLKNQGGVLFLRTYYDTIQNSSSLASFQYSRFEKNNTYTYRLNYAARNNGTAIQHELDWTHKINKKTYTESNIGIASKKIFPYFKLAGSVFRSLPKDYEAELGLKYVRLSNFSTYSFIGGLAKTYNDIWINFRGYILYDGQYVYNAGRLQTRLYMNNRTEYLTALGGWGTAPDDKSLDFLLNKFVGIVTRFVGAGYQKEYKYRTTIGVLGTWNNIRVYENGYANQYNLFLTLLRKF